MVIFHSYVSLPEGNERDLSEQVFFFQGKSQEVSNHPNHPQMGEIFMGGEWKVPFPQKVRGVLKVLQNLMKWTRLGYSDAAELY